MIINTKITGTLKIEDKEKETLTNAYLILKRLSEIFPKDKVLFSDITGEIIEIKELARFEGILSGLIENENWEF